MTEEFIFRIPTPMTERVLDILAVGCRLLAERAKDLTTDERRAACREIQDDLDAEARRNAS